MIQTHCRTYNGDYTGERLNRIAFPMGGMGAGMICLEGTGALSHVSLRHRPEIFHEPCLFSALCVNSVGANRARVLEGPVPAWKYFGAAGTGTGGGGKTYGLPRFASATFRTRFPFATVSLADPAIPMMVQVTGWSPFIPGDADNSSLPVAGLEFRFVNSGPEPLEAVYSFNAANFLRTDKDGHGVREVAGGFVLIHEGSAEKPWEQAAFAAAVDDPAVLVNPVWFRGGWYDALTMAWKQIQEGQGISRSAATEGPASPGGSLYVPFTLGAGEERTVRLRLSWYVPRSNLREGVAGEASACGPGCGCRDDSAAATYRPWYGARFSDLDAIDGYWRTRYTELRQKTKTFSDCFYDTTLPPEVVEAVAGNLTILKSPTVLRQADGRFWAWEGCGDERGCCAGSCTHVWNYAQALPHLFADLERSLRQTEFGDSQDSRGHQQFRAALPIQPALHNFHAAADGQLGGIMKVYREWRISGDTHWLRSLWPKVRQSLDYCIETWDPGHEGLVEEPHHNTYDIEFWGPDGMCTSFYLGALEAAAKMGEVLGEDVSGYRELYASGRRAVEADLYNGEYFIQKIQWQGLRAGDPTQFTSMIGNYSSEAKDLLEKEGPKYQYGTGCLSDGVLGAWLALVCGVGEILDREKVRSHLRAVHRYNLKKDLSEHVNPQRPCYALGHEGGLLLCTWPKGGKLSLPFVYSDEVWTGIEYQVASHLMMMGLVEEGLEIVRTCRDRYDGRVRNPFNEYECGHWYARAMSSYSLLQALSGARYDAVEKALYLTPAVSGNFRAFLATATGYGTVGIKDGKPFLEVCQGTIEVKRIEVGS